MRPGTDVPMPDRSRLIEPGAFSRVPIVVVGVQHRTEMEGHPDTCTMVLLIIDEGVTMDAKALNGMAVVSLEEGTKLGAIEQPLFDMATRQLGALEVAGDAGRFVVPFDQIRQIGSDAVTV